MKSKTLLTLALTSTVILAGCSSTGSDITYTNGQPNFPPMKVLSESPYVWDDTKSEALNVAQMAQPAGVGNGMSDYIDGTQASIGMQGSGMRILDGSLGLLSGGIFGLVQSESLSQGVNRQVEWKPTVVDIVDKDVISENGQISFLKTRAYIANKVKAAIEKDYPDIVWGDTLTFMGKEFKPSITQVIKSESKCKAIRNVDARDKDVIPFMTNNYSKFYYDGRNVDDSYCVLRMDLSITSASIKNQIVIIAQTTKGHYLDSSLVNHYEGYVMVPDIYFVNAIDAIKTDYAFVMKSGEKLLFQKP